MYLRQSIFLLSLMILKIFKVLMTIGIEFSTHYIKYVPERRKLIRNCFRCQNPSVPPTTICEWDCLDQSERWISTTPPHVT